MSGRLVLLRLILLLWGGVWRWVIVACGRFLPGPRPVIHEAQQLQHEVGVLDASGSHSIRLSPVRVGHPV
jgi:hypothetical protein